MYQINDNMPLGCIYESEDGDTKYCPMCNHDDVPYCQWFEDEPEAAIGIDERPVYCPLEEYPEPCEDAVSRQAAIDALADMHCKSDEDGYVWIIRSDAWARIDALPSVQPEYRLDEWCTDCKEYDTEKHCSPRFNQVIRTTLNEMKSERKKGKWIDYSDEGYVECPFCHSATNCDGNKDELHFCFSCGADLRGEQDG